MATQIEVLRSGLWQLNSVVLANSGECLIVDPGYFPRELDEVVKVTQSFGKAKSLVFTHGHWDHIAGWSYFPRTTVFGSRALQQAIADGSIESQTNLMTAQNFDSRWYIERPQALTWPKIEPLREGQRVYFGRTSLLVFETPGHSKDGLALLLEEEGILIAGDYLSPLEIPFVQSLNSYRNTLERFLSMLPSLNRIIPGHGPILSVEQAQEIALADLLYLDELKRCALKKDFESASKLALPRAQNVCGMHDSHLENCRNVISVEASVK